MIEKVLTLFQRLPIAKMLRRHENARCEAQGEQEAIRELQRYLDKRLKVIEWMTPTNKDQTE